ncbi:hypothetical protein GS496_06115 [Rhodococcus hoagii]|nr:hypothetical protein [Prescottella equi]
MGKPQPNRDPAMPTMSVDDAVLFCRERGVDLVTASTVKTAIRKRELRRYLIANRVRLSENDIRSWIESTGDAVFTPRHIPGRAS